MAILQDLHDALTSGQIEVVDLTAPLTADTPTLQLPPEFGQTARFELEEISRYDDRGPAWYWNNFRTGEHTGTRFDAPNHWISGRDSEDVASVSPDKLVAPAVVLDFTTEVAADDDFLLEVEHIEAWQEQHGPLPTAAGCCSAPDGTCAHARSRSSSTQRIRAHVPLSHDDARLGQIRADPVAEPRRVAGDGNHAGGEPTTHRRRFRQSRPRPCARGALTP